MVDEALLLRRCREGDREAFEEIVRKKRNVVFWTAYRVVGNEETAKDVSQAVFLRLWGNLSKIHPDKPLDPWLHRVTVNLGIDEYRKIRSRGRHVRVLQDGEADFLESRVGAAESPDSAVAQKEIQRIFDRLADRLSPMQRAVFVLMGVAGHSAQEVGSLLGIRPSTVRNHLLHARRHLRSGLRKLYPEYWRRGTRK